MRMEAKVMMKGLECEKNSFFGCEAANVTGKLGRDVRLRTMVEAKNKKRIGGRRRWQGG